MDIIKGVIGKLAWPMAVVAVAYIVGQTVVDTWGE